MSGIRVTATDLDNGDTATREIQSGDYVVIPAEPLYLAGVVRHANGTTVLTLKNRKEGS